MVERALTLDRTTVLTFPIELSDGKTLATIGDAAHVFETLTEKQREASHWGIAIRMMDHALKEPTYLKTATLSLQTALAMDGLLDHMH